MGSQQQDWGFVGPAYTAADPYQDSQVLVNYYLEVDKTQGAKTVTALLGCPGLAFVITVPGGQPAGGGGGGGGGGVSNLNTLITENADYLVTENGDILVSS